MQAAYSISAVTIGFIIYHFAISDNRLERYFIKRDGAEKAKVSWVIFQRLTGVVIFGIIPFILIVVQNVDFERIGLTFQNKESAITWIFGLILLSVAINSFVAKKPDHQDMYPQIRTPQPWGKSLLFVSALTLFLYTLAYEIMFRGYLLFTCRDEMGPVLAITINTSIYTLVHIPKGWKETIGAIPMGIILCWLTLKTGNIWIAVVVHVAVAWSSEWFSIYYGKKKLEIGN